MLSAGYLANLSDDMIEIYSELELEIKRDIFKRLNKLKRITDDTLYQMELLQQTGALRRDIIKLVDEYNIKARRELVRLYNEAMGKAQKMDLAYSPTVKRELSANQQQALNTLIDRMIEPEKTNKTFALRSIQFEKIWESLARMTATVVDHSERAFIKECNLAFMKVSTGSHSWQNAYRTAVCNLSKNAVKTGYDYTLYNTPHISYTGSGKLRQFTIESACRMNILTGINQSASQQTLENCDELETSLVEVSAHLGARDVDRDGREWSNHAAWQGKIFSLKENGEMYKDEDGIEHYAPNFNKSCGLGEPDGICGINCRHSFYPYFPGTPREYSKGELSEMKESTVTLDGKEISQYEAEEKLRFWERQIRQNKSEALGYELTKDTDNNPNYIKARNRIYEAQHEAAYICNSTGIQRKYINEFIGTPTGSQPRGLKPKED